MVLVLSVACKFSFTFLFHQVFIVFVLVENHFEEFLGCFATTFEGHMLSLNGEDLCHLLLCIETNSFFFIFLIFVSVI